MSDENLSITYKVNINERLEELKKTTTFVQEKSIAFHTEHVNAMDKFEVYVKKEITELRTKFESYTTTNHTQAIREDQQKQITELQAKVSNPEWLDVVILKLMEPMKEVLLDFINFHWSLESEGQTHEKDLTYEEKYNKHAELSKKLSGGCTSQCGKDWNDSFCSDCNDSKPIKPIEGPISYAPKTDSKPETLVGSARQTVKLGTHKIDSNNRRSISYTINGTDVKHYVYNPDIEAVVTKEDLKWLLGGNINYSKMKKLRERYGK